VRIAYDGAEALATGARNSSRHRIRRHRHAEGHGYEVARRMSAESATSGCVLVAVTAGGRKTTASARAERDSTATW
jgi:hypothetical protein